MPRVKSHGSCIDVWVSARDTQRWARRWPCSDLAGKRLYAHYDTHGLLDLKVNGYYPRTDIDVNEFNALMCDVLKAWGKRDEIDDMIWFIVVGQFEGLHDG